MKSEQRMLQMHGICVLVAFLSSASAWNFHQVSVSSVSSVFGYTRTATSSSSLDMTSMRRTKRSPNPSRSKKRNTKSQFDSILEDGEGHINADLASSLWNWDHQHRENAHLPKLSLSTRQGLRLVHDVVDEIADSPRGQKLLRSEDIRTELVQEGIIALMDALNEYRLSADAITQDDPNLDPNQQFQAYARPYLEDRLWHALDRTARPLELPEIESNLVRHIQAIRPKLQEELGGRQPTIQEIADRLEMPVETLELLLAARRNTLSVESTVEIMTPRSVVDTKPSFTDQDKWDAQEGHLLDTGDGKLKEEVLVEEYQDEMYENEGDDEAWLHETQVAGPLRDLIPDGGPTPDDAALSDMIRHDVGEFLTNTLTPEEVLVVRMAFGLDGGKQIVYEEIALALAMKEKNATDMPELMPVEDVKKILKGAVQKLRINYRNNYIEYLEEEEDFYGQDSV